MATNKDRPNDRPNRDFPEDRFIVICRDDTIGRLKGPYVLATRQTFGTRRAATGYARTVNLSRDPIVVSGRFHQLRDPIARDQE